MFYFIGGVNSLINLYSIVWFLVRVEFEGNVKKKVFNEIWKANFEMILQLTYRT